MDLPGIWRVYEITQKGLKPVDNLRRFLVVFTAMFFIAAAICGYVLVQSYDDAEGKQVEQLNVSAPTYDPNSSSTQAQVFRENILCIVGDSGKSVPELMFLMNVDSVSGSISFLFIPQNLKYGITQSSEVGTFGEYGGRYAWNTADRVGSLVSSFLDVNVDYYFTLSTSDFGKMISTFSSEDQGVYFDIPVDLEYKNGSVSVSISSGPQYLKGDTVAQFIQFYQTANGIYSAEMLPYYDGTDVKRIQQVQLFLDAFMRQKFTEASTSVYRDQFSALMYPYFAKGNTNLTAKTLDQIATVISGLRTENVNYYMLNGNTVFNQQEYLEYNSTIRNFLLEESISTVKAEDVLSARFGTGV